MNLDQVINSRHSTRAYTKDKIDKEKLQRILNAANMAPSAGNLQAYEIFVVINYEKRKALAKTSGDQDFLSQAPVCLVFCANPDESSSRYGKRGRNLYCVQDATIAAAFAVLKAVDEGLSTAWVGSFDDDTVRKIVGCGSSVPVAIIPIGEPAEKPSASERKSLSDLVHFLE